MSTKLQPGEIRGNSPRMERWLFFYIPMFFALFFLVGPFYWMLITALKPDSELYDGAKSPLYVATPSLDHFRFLFEKTEFVTWTWNTMMVATPPPPSRSRWACRPATPWRGCGSAARS